MLVTLYLAAAAVNLVSVAAMDTGQILTGEEMSVSIRDVLFSVEQHAQASVWSTNFGAPVFYWVASHLDQDYSLFSARRWKACAMALLAPLVYLVLLRRLGCARPAATLGAATAVLLPGVAMFGWLATENGLETVLGAAGLYCATSARRVRRAAPLLAGLAVTTHTSGLAWAVVILAVYVVRAARPDGAGRHHRPVRPWVRVLDVLSALVVPVAVVCFPLLWWTVGPKRIISGGGVWDGDALANLGNLGHQLAVDGESYYFPGTDPALGSTALAVAALLAAVLATRRRAVWPWLAVAAGTVVLWLPAGNAPGVRRAIALSVVAALVLAVAVDMAWRATGVRTAVPVAAAAVLVLLPLLGSTVTWQESFASGERRLVADFRVLPGPMPATFARWDLQLRTGVLTPRVMIDHFDGLRTMAVVWMLADRTGKGTNHLPRPEEIVAVTTPVNPRG